MRSFLTSPSWVRNWCTFLRWSPCSWITCQGAQRGRAAGVRGRGRGSALGAGARAPDLNAGAHEGHAMQGTGARARMRSRCRARRHPRSCRCSSTARRGWGASAAHVRSCANCLRRGSECGQRLRHGRAAGAFQMHPLRLALSCVRTSGGVQGRPSPSRARQCPLLTSFLRALSTFLYWGSGGEEGPGHEWEGVRPNRTSAVTRPPAASRRRRPSNNQSTTGF